MTSVHEKSKMTPRKGLRTAVHGRYPSNIEIGSIQSLISNTNEEGLELIQGMLSQRQARIGFLKTNVSEPPQYEGIGTGQTETPDRAKPREKLWDRVILRDLPIIAAWGALSPGERSADKETLRLASILTGSISRLKASNLTDGEILSILKGVGADAEIAKAISVGNLLDASFDQSPFTGNGRILWAKISAYVSGLIEPAQALPTGNAMEEATAAAVPDDIIRLKRKRVEDLGEVLFAV